jgi:hypothetical protein
MAGFCLAFGNLQRFERQLADFHLPLQFGDSVRKPVPCTPLKMHPAFFLTSIPTLVDRKNIEPDLVIPEDPLFAAHQPGAPCLLRV